MLHLLEDLDGLTVARGLVTDEGAASLTLMAPSGFAGEANDKFYPAESMTIDTLDGIQALHDVLGRMLEEAAIRG